MPCALSTSSVRFLGLVSLAACAACAACGGKTLDFSPAVATPLGTSVSSCPALGAAATVTTGTGAIVISRMCVRDEKGRYYAGQSDPNAAPGESGSVPVVLPADHTYALVYEFAPGFTPTRASAAPTAAVVYVGSSAPELDPCADAGVAPPAASTTTFEGNLLVQQLSNAVGMGQYVSSVVDVGALFGGACSDTSASPHVFCASGFGDMFYVGSAPAMDGAPATATGGVCAISSDAGPGDAGTD
jgi:hypothetical protein